MRTRPPLPNFEPVRDDYAPMPSVLATGALLIGLLVTAFTLQGKNPMEVAQWAAIGLGLSLAASAVFEFRKSVRNLIRADLMALLALYFLTLAEFVMKQDLFDELINVPVTRRAVIACIWGFAGLAIGRHLPNLRKHPLSGLLTYPLPRLGMIVLFWSFFFLGFLHMLVAVDFDISEMFHQFVAPRFTQPWTRGKFGDWRALLVELGMLLYLLPPITGIIWARWRNYPKLHVFLISLGFLFLLFYAFTNGTRNVFTAYLVTLLIGFAFSGGRKLHKQTFILSALFGVLLVASTVVMLRFRDIGFENWIRSKDLGRKEADKVLYVDNNLYAICRLVRVFPETHSYLGLEIPYLALIRPIPRALWKSKPEKMSLSIEEVMGAENLTIATSFVGEAYMSGGMIGILLCGIFFGAFTGWWGHLASPRNSELGILIYASGFFAVVISMRSLLVFTTAILPPLAGLAIAFYMVDKQGSLQRPFQRFGKRPMNRGAEGP